MRIFIQLLLLASGGRKWQEVSRHWTTSSSIVVKHWPNNYKVAGSCPATGAIICRHKMGENI